MLQPVSCSVVLQDIQRSHIQRTFSDIGYNFLVSSDDTVYEGRGWDKLGAHTKGFNSGSIGIAFIGHFSNYAPTAAMIRAAKDLIACEVNNGKLSSSYKLYGHRQTKATECPGNYLYNDIKTWDNWSSEYLYRTSRCDSVRGKCREAGSPCDGVYLRGKCPGTAICCTPTLRCDAEGGTCQEDSSYCAGNYVSGKCPGPSNIRCCIP